MMKVGLAMPVAFQVRRFASASPQTLIGLVSRLRKETQAPLAKCKEALLQANGSYDAATAYLREFLMERGRNAVQQARREELKASTVFFSAFQRHFTVSEIASETDFVSNNPLFAAMGQETAKFIADNTMNNATPSDVAKLNEMLLPLLSKYSSTFGEKLQLVDYYSGLFPLSSHRYGLYTHQSIRPSTAVNGANPSSDVEGGSFLTDAGSMLCFVAFDKDFLAPPSCKVTTRQIAQHILANSPDSINVKQPSLQKKSEPDGNQESSQSSDTCSLAQEFQLKKQNCLMSQPFLFDESKSVGEILDGNSVSFFIIKQKGQPVKYVAQ